MKKTAYIGMAMGAALAVLFAVTTPAGAQGNIKIGLVEVLPSITQKGTWYSNIDLNSGRAGVAGEEERSDYVNTVTPAINFVLAKPLLNVRFGVRADIIRYKEYDQNDSNDFYLNLNGTYGELGRQGLYFKASEAFARVQDPYSQSTLEDTRYREGQAIKRKTNEAGIEVGYGLRGLYSAHVSYKNQYLKYRDRADYDSNTRDNIYGAALYYRIMPKTFARLGYDFTQRDYFDYNSVNPLFTTDVGKDSHIHHLTAGVVWDQTAKLNGEIKAGYSWHRYRQSRDRFNNRLEDFSNWTLAATLGWLPRERTTVNFTAQMGERDSVDQSFYSYDQYILGVDIIQAVVHRLEFTLGGSYEKNDFNASPGQTRSKNYDIYTGRVGVNYQLLKWVSLGLGYTYVDKGVSGSINYIDDEYTDHRTMFTITGSL